MFSRLQYKSHHILGTLIINQTVYDGGYLSLCIQQLPINPYYFLFFYLQFKQLHVISPG